MAARNMPVAEVEITDELVRGLLGDQHADLAELPRSLVANGWDNAVFRLGDELCLRMPRRAAAADLVLHEQRWLPELALRLPLPVPAPVRTGVAGRGYPWMWSICPWFDGELVADVGLTDPPEAARSLGAFVAALHHPSPVDAPVNPVRGHPIDELGARIDQNLRALGLERADEVRARWTDLADTPPWHGPPVWIHGDLHSANVVVAPTDGGNEINAVIDFGDIAGADPAVDLAIGWMLFGSSERDVFRAVAGQGQFPVDDATWRRAEAWALHFAVVYLANSADNPRIAGMGRRLLASVLDD